MLFLQATAQWWSDWTIWIWILLYVAFCTIMAISRQKEAKSLDYALLLFRLTSRVLYSAQYHRHHCTLHAFEQFRALYMHNHDDKYPSRPRFEPYPQITSPSRYEWGIGDWAIGLPPCKAKSQYLLTLQISINCLLAFKNSIVFLVIRAFLK